MANEIWKLVNELHRQASTYERYQELSDEEKMTALNGELDRIKFRLTRCDNNYDLTDSYADNIGV